MTDFFDTIEPTLYDLSLPYVVPGVADAREVRQRSFTRLMDRAAGWTGIDIGIGTGSDIVTLLPANASGQIYGLDESRHLTEKIGASGRLPSPEHHKIAAEVLIADFAGDSPAPMLLERVPEGLDFATSAFAIHNVPIERQRAAFQNVAQMLKIGSPFFYLDLISYDDGELRRAADEADIAFIESQMTLVPQGVDPAKWHGLQSRWIEHYQHENYLSPLSSRYSSRITSMLTDAGFGAVEVLYRFHNTTLLLSRRER